MTDTILDAADEMVKLLRDHLTDPIGRANNKEWIKHGTPPQNTPFKTPRVYVQTKEVRTTRARNQLGSVKQSYLIVYYLSVYVEKGKKGEISSVDYNGYAMTNKLVGDIKAAVETNQGAHITKCKELFEEGGVYQELPARDIEGTAKAMPTMDLFTITYAGYVPNI